MLAAQQADAGKRAKPLQDAFAAYRAALQTIETIRQGSLRADEARTTFLATTRDVFNARFGAEPEMVIQAPGRVNLIGEHVDYADGLCLPFAIAQRTVVEVAFNPPPLLVRRRQDAPPGASRLLKGRLEPLDGVPTHSGVSVARGELES